MENGNSKSEEMDKEFLEELNSLTKQLKTDEEIQKDLKLNQSKNKEDKTKEKDNDDNNINENPFSEAFNEINSKNPNFFDFENNGLIFDSMNEKSAHKFEKNEKEIWESSVGILGSYYFLIE